MNTEHSQSDTKGKDDPKVKEDTHKSDGSSPIFIIAETSIVAIVDNVIASKASGCSGRFSNSS
jgi:hypothetical protein